MKKSIVMASSTLVAVMVLFSGSLTLTTGDAGLPATADIIVGSFTYSSSIDDIDGLYARYAYPAESVNMTALVLMHGFIQGASFFSDDTLRRLAGYGLFVIAPGMRGRDGAEGAPDCSAREAYDIMDALAFARQRFPGVVSQERAAIVGYSGGGGNALACAVKFPDAFTDVIDYFGISDYGYDDEYGWYHHNAVYRDTLEEWVGGVPEEAADAYYARAHLYGLTNYRGGLYFFHDMGDRSVPADQTLRCIALLDSHGMTGYEADVTGPGSEVRWLHGMPEDGEPICNSESFWAVAVASGEHPVLTVPESGHIRVHGYAVTKRFSIWLGDGTCEAADVDYDTRSGIYAVRPLTGGMTVTISQDGRTTKKSIDDSSVIYL